MCGEERGETKATENMGRRKDRVGDVEVLIGRRVLVEGVRERMGERRVRRNTWRSAKSRRVEDRYKGRKGGGSEEGGQRMFNVSSLYTRKNSANLKAP